MSESKRAKWIVQGFEIAQKNPRVREMLQYLLAQPAKKYRFFDTSIVSTRGKVTKTFKALQRWANGAMSNGRIANSAVLAVGGGGGGWRRWRGQPPYQDPNANTAPRRHAGPDTNAHRPRPQHRTPPQPTHARAVPPGLRRR